MVCIGFDRNHKLKNLSNTLEDYYAGVAKRYSSIVRLQIQYTDSDVKPAFSNGIAKGDFALLRAFLQDHETALSVDIISEDDTVLSLYFPDYLYGFVEDTFARAIHHKIEGSGYVCRECVGKYQLNLREYDRQFLHVVDQDISDAARMSLCRLRFPVQMLDNHRVVYEDFIRDNDAMVIKELIDQDRDISGEVDFMIKNGLLSRQSALEALNCLSETKDAQTVALLLKYAARKRTRLSLQL